MKDMYLLYVLLSAIVLNNNYNVEARSITDYYDDNDIDNVIEVPDANGLYNNDVVVKSRRSLINDVAFHETPPPKLIQKPGNVLNIVCEVVGKPLPTVEWIVGHYPIEEIEQQQSNVITEFNSNAFGKVRATHVIDYVLKKPEIYTCVARGVLKAIYASTIVYPTKHLGAKDFPTLHDTMMSSIKPIIIYSHRTHCDILGSSIVLPCKVHARPNADVVWLDSNNNRIEQNQHFKLLPTGDLLITELRWSDTGRYQCIATNNLGVDTAEVSLYTMAKN